MRLFQRLKSGKKNRVIFYRYQVNDASYHLLEFAPFFIGKSDTFRKLFTIIYCIDHFSVAETELGRNLTSEEVVAICGEPVSDDTFLQMRFFSSGVIVCAVGAFGLVGNILTCLTLGTMSMTVFNKLLLTLALTDLIFIMAGGAFMTNVAFG